MVNQEQNGNRTWAPFSADRKQAQVAFPLRAPCTARSSPYWTICRPEGAGCRAGFCPARDPDSAAHCCVEGGSQTASPPGCSAAPARCTGTRKHISGPHTPHAPQPGPAHTPVGTHLHTSEKPTQLAQAAWLPAVKKPSEERLSKDKRDKGPSRKGLSVSSLVPLQKSRDVAPRSVSLPEAGIRGL